MKLILKSFIASIFVLLNIFSGDVFSFDIFSKSNNLQTNRLKRVQLRSSSNNINANKCDYEASSISDIYNHVKIITHNLPKTSYSHNSSRRETLANIRLMFRGQRKLEWSLLPGICRKENFDETSALRHLKMLHYLKFDNDKQNLSINDLSHAQHYGLHTRLLDFTGNLLSAIFFAVEKAEDPQETENALYVLDGATLNELSYMNEEDKGIFMPTSFETLLRLRAAEARNFSQVLAYPDIIASSKLNKIDLKVAANRRKIADKLRYPIAVYPNMDNPKIIAQDGRFVIWGGKTWPDFYEKDSKNENRDIHIKPFSFEDIEERHSDVKNKAIPKFLYKISIKNCNEIRKELKIYGINRAKMCQSVDDTTKWLNDIWSGSK